MFTEAADRHGPTGIEQVMRHHEEERPRADAQHEHKRHEIGQEEVDSPALETDRQSRQTDQGTANQQLHRQIPPLGQVQRLGLRIRI